MACFRQGVASQPVLLDKNVMRPAGTIDAAAHDDILLCHVRDKVLERVKDIRGCEKGTHLK